ncbi:MAG TPA: RES family NAD+ phosphorylase [Edaphobacter sp.]
MRRVFRLVRKRFAATPFDGEGSVRFGGRFSSRGTRVVYTAENLSLCMWEYFVHINETFSPDDLMLVVAEVPDTVSRVRMEPKDLPPDWQSTPAPAHLAKYGDSFVRDAKAAILIVPSAIVLADDNWLLNPAHPDFRLISEPLVTPYPLDPRVLAMLKNHIKSGQS